MGAAGLEIWAEVGLVVFLLLFVAVLVHTFTRRNHERFERARSMPLEDDPAPRQERAIDDEQR